MLDLVKVIVKFIKSLLLHEEKKIYFLTSLQMFDCRKSEVRMRVIFITITIMEVLVHVKINYAKENSGMTLFWYQHRLRPWQRALD